MDRKYTDAPSRSMANITDTIDLDKISFLDPSDAREAADPRLRRSDDVEIQYEGYSIQKNQAVRDPGTPLTWEDVIVRPMKCSRSELVEMAGMLSGVRDNDYIHRMLEAVHLTETVFELINQKARADTHPNAIWRLVGVEPIYKTLRARRGTAKEVDYVNVVLRRERRPTTSMPIANPNLGNTQTKDFAGSPPSCMHSNGRMRRGSSYTSSSTSADTPQVRFVEGGSHPGMPRRVSYAGEERQGHYTRRIYRDIPDSSRNTPSRPGQDRPPVPRSQRRPIPPGRHKTYTYGQNISQSALNDGGESDGSVDSYIPTPTVFSSNDSSLQSTPSTTPPCSPNELPRILVSKPDVTPSQHRQTPSSSTSGSSTLGARPATTGPPQASRPELIPHAALEASKAYRREYNPGDYVPRAHPERRHSDTGRREPKIERVANASGKTDARLGTQWELRADRDSNAHEKSRRRGSMTTENGRPSEVRRSHKPHVVDERRRDRGSK